MELKIVEIRDRGEKKERIFIEVLGDCNLHDFIVYDETFDEDGKKSNVWPHMYRFENYKVYKGEFVSLRIHKGNNQKGHLSDGKTVCHYFYWGFDSNLSILNNDGDTIHLVKIECETKKTIG